MKNRNYIGAILFISLSFGGCNMKPASKTFYVEVNPSQVEALFSYVGRIASEDGLSLNPGRASDDKGNTLRVLEAKNWRVKLWMQNVPLSGHEDRRLCGEYSEPHPDPGQYLVTVSSPMPLVGRRSAASLFTKLANNLKGRGYTILNEPKVCSKFAR